MSQIWKLKSKIWGSVPLKCGASNCLLCVTLRRHRDLSAFILGMTDVYWQTDKMTLKYLLHSFKIRQTLTHKHMGVFSIKRGVKNCRILVTLWRYNIISASFFGKQQATENEEKDFHNYGVSPTFSTNLVIRTADPRRIHLGGCCALPVILFFLSSQFWLVVGVAPALSVEHNSSGFHWFQLETDRWVMTAGSCIHDKSQNGC